MTKAHTAANDSLTGWVHVYEALGGHGLCSLDGGDLVHTQNPVKTTRLGLQCPACQFFNLQLTGIRRELAPLTNRALIAAECSSNFCLRAVVLSDFKCFHAVHYEPSNMRCLIYFYMALLCFD